MTAAKMKQLRELGVGAMTYDDLLSLVDAIEQAKAERDGARAGVVALDDLCAEMRIAHGTLQDERDAAIAARAEAEARVTVIAELHRVTSLANNEALTRIDDLRARLGTAEARIAELEKERDDAKELALLFSQQGKGAAEIVALRARIAELEAAQIDWPVLGTLAAENDRIRARLDVAAEALKPFAHLLAIIDKLGVRNLVAGWNGEGRPDGPYAERHPPRLEAILPTDCGTVYALDAATESARAALTEIDAGKPTEENIDA